MWGRHALGFKFQAQSVGRLRGRQGCEAERQWVLELKISSWCLRRGLLQLSEPPGRPVGRGQEVPTCDPLCR